MVGPRNLGGVPRHSLSRDRDARNKHGSGVCSLDARGALRVTHCKLAAMGSQLIHATTADAMHAKCYRPRLQHICPFSCEVPLAAGHHDAPIRRRIRCSVIPSRNQASTLYTTGGALRFAARAHRNSPSNCRTDLQRWRGRHPAVSRASSSPEVARPAAVLLPRPALPAASVREAGGQVRSCSNLHWGAPLPPPPGGPSTHLLVPVLCMVFHA